MINHEYKFIFIHIPRTGGSSIEQCITGDEARKLNTMNGREQKHNNLFEYKETMNRETFNEYFKFTFVRNPWDVMISKYVAPWYGRKHGGEIGQKAGKSLKYFLEHYNYPEHEHGDTFFDYFDPKQMDSIAAEIFSARYTSSFADIFFNFTKTIHFIF